MRPGVAGVAAVAAMVGFAVSWDVLHRDPWERGEMRDTPLYERYGDAMARGQVPYRDFEVEYPPAALPAFVVPSLLVGTNGEPTEEYHDAFEWTMFLCGIVSIALMAGVLVGLGASSARLVLALGFAALAPLGLGSVVLSRFDLWPAALTLLALSAFLASADRAGAALLAVAVAAKLYPAVLLPLAAAWVWRRRGRREAAAAGAVFAVTLAAIVLPFVVVAPAGFVDSLWEQLRRPLQIEALGAAVLLSLEHVTSLDVTVETAAGSEGIAGGWGAAVGAAHTVAQLAVLVWLSSRFAGGPAEPERFLRYAAAAVLAFVALGRVLSPQFLLWLVPLVPLVAGRRGLVGSALLGAALVSTQLWFPARYWEYAGNVDAGLTATVLARDLVLVAALVVLVGGAGRRRPSAPAA